MVFTQAPHFSQFINPWQEMSFLEFQHAEAWWQVRNNDFLVPFWMGFESAFVSWKFLVLLISLHCWILELR